MGIEGRPPDYRFTMANERTYLAWVRTALALVAGGLAAAKALDFQHELARWIVAGPPVVAGTALALVSVNRWRAYESAMTVGAPLPVGRLIRTVGVALAAYGTAALLAAMLD